MAQKRMFSLSVVDTDKFLEMPISSRLLYYELGMRADDDGFVDNWKKILMFTGLKEDDMKVLISKQFIIPFESGIIVIRHWRLNNYLQNDRTKPTLHQEELKQLEFDNGEYNLILDNYIDDRSKYLNNSDWKDKRKDAYENSELPYSFDYKIRKAFIGKLCPICGYEMKDYVNAPHRPTIQHNLPISKGGKHELGNISVICHKCNISIRDKETGPLNSQEVIEEWDKINECIQGCIHSIDKNSIDKNSIEEKEIYKEKERFKKPTLVEVKEYCDERNNDIDAQRFIDFYESKNWMIGKNKMKDWKACIRTWEKRNDNTSDLPDWFNKDIQNKKISIEEKQEINDIINNF